MRWIKLLYHDPKGRVGRSEFIKTASWLCQSSTRERILTTPFRSCHEQFDTRDPTSIALKFSLRLPTKEYMICAAYAESGMDSIYAKVGYKIVSIRI